jgi:transcriptional regulator with GAF, ATPase, and Fis domain
MENAVSPLAADTLASVIPAVGESLDIEEALANVTGVLGRAFPSRNVSATLLKGDGTVIISAPGHARAGGAPPTPPFGKASLGRIAREGRPFVMVRGSPEPLFPRGRSSFPGRDWITALGAPVRLHGSPAGFLSLSFNPEAPGGDPPGELAALETVASLVAQMLSLNRRIRDREEGLVRENLLLRTGASGPVTPLGELERNEVLRALTQNDWIQTRAARDLGITLRQMGYRIRKFELEDLVGRHRPRKPGGGRKGKTA